MFEPYWDRHPTQHALVLIIREGHWVTHVFEWLFMMISRFAGYAMTLAIGYLIYYAIEFKHSLDAMSMHPGFADQLASLSNVLINVGPELVFPGVVVLCIRAFQRRAWVDAALYLVTTIWFVILTMVLLNAYMANQITADFLSAMLFWRAGAALFYTVVAAYAGGHGGLDFKSLLTELDTLRAQLDRGQHTVSTLRDQVSTLQQQVDTERRRARTDLDTLRGQLDLKQQEIEGLRRALTEGQEWQASRVSSLQQELDAEHAQVSTLRRELDTARLSLADVQARLERKQQEIEQLQAALSSEQHEVSTLRRERDTRLSTGQDRSVSSGQGRPVESGQASVQVSTGPSPLDTGQQGKVLLLDTSRSRKPGAEDRALGEQVRDLLAQDATLSARAIAARLGCSPTTAAKWKSLIEHERQASNA